VAAGSRKSVKKAPVKNAPPLKRGKLQKETGGGGLHYRISSSRCRTRNEISYQLGETARADTKAALKKGTPLHRRKPQQRMGKKKERKRKKKKELI